MSETRIGQLRILALDHDVDPVAVRAKRRHRVRQLPDLGVLGVEDVRAVRLVEHALHVLGADQAAGHFGALEEGRLDPFLSQAPGHGASG